MSREDELEIENLLRRLKNVGGIEKFENIAFKGDDMDPKLISELEKYDEFMENVMWTAITQENGIDSAVSEIKDAAQDNEFRNGTESYFVVDFLSWLCDYLNV